MNRAWPSLQSGRCDFDAVALPDHYDPGTDDLPFVIREHFQLPLNQQFQVLDDVGEITWRSGRIEAQVSCLVLLKLPLPNFGRSAGHVPASTGGVQTILPSPIVSPTPRKPAAISEIISDILRLVGLLDFLRRLMLGLQGIETEERPDHRPQPFPETSA